MKYSSLAAHFTAAIIITGIILLIYASVQQTFRASANDPQIQIARDLSYALSKGKPADQLFSNDTIDLTQSLAVFEEFFDRNGRPLHSTGFLNDAFPQPPQGVFKFTNTNMEDVLTWQPQPNVRMAMVFEKIISHGAGFVAVGRSLKETEIRESNLVKMILITWIACMAVLLAHLLIHNYIMRKV